MSFKHKEFKHPIFLRNNSSDIPTFGQILIDRDYDFEIDFTPNIIIDLGANIGLAALYFKNKFPTANIVCVEPEQSNFKLLQMNTSQYDNVVCLNNGIWNKNTNLIIEDSKSGFWGFMVRETTEITANSIQAISINEIMSQLNIEFIDILKIDIEGSEKELFETNYEEWMPKVKIIIIELHDRMRAGSAKSFFKALVQYNFSLTMRGENIICIMN
ncbi:MAG: FkbM family methyltransferase [Ignavibacteria bacterium]|nr:FkbM family methyltransferase [Ignavibacteria bacterium]